MTDLTKTLVTALREIAWSNDTKWQADRARAALATYDAAPQAALDTMAENERELGLTMDEPQAGQGERLTERGAFERTMQVGWPFDGKRPDGSYTSPEVQGQWRAWQARAASAAVPLGYALVPTTFECNLGQSDASAAVPAVTNEMAAAYWIAVEEGPSLAASGPREVAEHRIHAALAARPAAPTKGEG